MTVYPLKGQKIVCIDDDWGEFSLLYPGCQTPKVGDRFIIEGVTKGIPRKALKKVAHIMLVGVRIPDCKNLWWASDQFRPLDQIDELQDQLASIPKTKNTEKARVLEFARR